MAAHAAVPTLEAFAIHASPWPAAQIAPTSRRELLELCDEDLIARAFDGSGLSLDETSDELFRRHQTRVIRWSYRFMRDREAAADCAQEILLRAYRNLHKYRGDCRFSTWLYVITRNVCLSAIQKRTCEPVWVAKTTSTELPDLAAFDVYEAVETEELRRKNWRFITDTLDQTEARVMLLHYGEELPLRAVSNILGLTNKSGAKAYIVSARRKLAAAKLRDTMRRTAA